MKTYQTQSKFRFPIQISPELKKLITPILIIIISLPAFSQELAIVKSSYQHVVSQNSTELVKANEAGQVNWINLSGNNEHALKIVTEKNMEVLQHSFKVCLDNRRAVINWTSYQDINTDYYVIERSVNGQPFKEVAQIFTSPDPVSKFDYQYFDKLSNDIKGTIFYRLKIQDAEGRPVYTPAQLASSNKSYENLMVSIKS